MHRKITIFNFDNAYKEQNFYSKEDYTVLDFTNLRGTSGLCEENSLQKIRNRIAQNPVSKINFIDSGNYHYISYLLLERIKEPFSLILFDHHTDMQPSMFENLLSCGCWVKRTLDENQYIKEVVIIGARQELITEIPAEYKDRVMAYSEQTINHTESWELFALQNIHYPVYISIDKDVLNPSQAVTNWDQGSLTLDQLAEVYHIILSKHNILGIDICGEYAFFDELGNQKNRKNNKANRKILDMLT